MRTLCFPLFLALVFLVNAFAVNSAASTLSLPRNFKFCVATAAHQIEGGNIHSDWNRWEHIPGKIKNGDTALIATDSWNHVDEDIANMKFLGVDTYRFSIEWAKIEPREGEFIASEIKRYRDFIQKLKANGIEPMVTLNHFTLPIWVADRGGWDWNGIIPAFDRFVREVVSVIGQEVTYWITINEPMSVIAGGYVSNVFPPAKNDLHSIAVPMENMIRAHARAYHSIHALLDTAEFKPKVGLAHHLRNFDPLKPRNPVDRYLAKKFDQIFNWSIPEALITGEFSWKVPFTVKANAFIPEAIETQDFFGLNYYSRDRLHLNLLKSPFIHRLTTPGKDMTELGWEIYPEGFDRLLTEIRIRHPKMEIWITENGLADRSDAKREKFMFDHLKVIESQLKAGAPIRGYCHWTLNDNFEWAEGYSANFGLFSLEPGTLRRMPRPSAIRFGEWSRGINKASHYSQ